MNTVDRPQLRAALRRFHRVDDLAQNCAGT
jgi:hypothetical protein